MSETLTSSRLAAIMAAVNLYAASACVDGNREDNNSVANTSSETGECPAEVSDSLEARSATLGDPNTLSNPEELVAQGDGLGAGGIDQAVLVNTREISGTISAIRVAFDQLPPDQKNGSSLQIAVMSGDFDNLGEATCGDEVVGQADFNEIEEAIAGNYSLEIPVNSQGDGYCFLPKGPGNSGQVAAVDIRSVAVEYCDEGDGTGTGTEN